MYGTTSKGFNDELTGTVFELSPEGNGKWTEKVVHTFVSNGKDGLSPNASLIFDAAGNLYGVTFYGGTDGQGTLFEITP